jgi:tetratricopeptide (TPR) repeat protein
MTDFESDEVHSRAGPSRSRDLSHWMRSYDNAPELERIWQRLETRRPARAWTQRAELAFAAVCLLGLGFGLGRSSAGLGEGTLADLREPRSMNITAEPAASAPPRAPAPREEKREETSRADSPAKRARARFTARPAPSLEPALPGDVELVEAATGAPYEGESWERLAEQGKYTEAFEALDESGELRRLSAEGSADDLMTLADIARFAGRTGWAIQLLREVTTRYAEDESAPLAAMTLGNLLDRAGDVEGAARAYSLCRRLAPYGDFAEDALVREFMLATGARDRARAARLFTEYQTLHPGGARAEEMGAALEQLGDSDPSAPGAERDIWGAPSVEAVEPLGPGREKESEKSAPASESLEP